MEAGRNQTSSARFDMNWLQSLRAANSQAIAGQSDVFTLMTRIFLFSGRSLLIKAALFLPTILAVLYFFGIAGKQYESEARFVVRSAAKPELPGGLAFLIQLGFARSQDDSFIVQDFMSSRDAVDLLRRKLPLVEMYSAEGADFLVRYPSIFFGRTDEEFFKYLQHAISIVHTDKTGISILKVRAFHPLDAKRIAATLLDLGEDLVNRINKRLLNDAVGNSLTELRTSQERLVSAQTALTEFRNRELILDPEKNAVALAELIAQLSMELASTRAKITEILSSGGANPQLTVLRRKAAAIDEQITRERARIASDTDGLASRIATYERLSLEREFSSKMMAAAEAEQVRTRTEAARQLLYLERVVEPNLSDYSTQPKRFRSVVTVFAANVLLLLIGWLILSGIREHASSH